MKRLETTERRETTIITRDRDNLYIQLRAENFELIQKLKDYDLKVKEYEELHSRYLDLEHNYKLVESERYKHSMEFKSTEVEVQKKVSYMEEEVRKNSDMLSTKQQQLKQLDVELIRTKEVVNERNREIIRLRALLDEGQSSVTKFSEERTIIEREMNMAIEAKKAIQIELDRVMLINERLTQSNKEMIERDREYSFESSKYMKHIDELTREIEMYRMQFEQKQRELEIAIESRRSIQMDIEKWGSNASKLQEDVYRLTKINKEYEEERSSFNKRINDTLLILNAKDQELQVSIRNLRIAEEKIITITTSHSRFDHEYEVIKRSLEAREEELINLRKFREEESSKRMGFEAEYKKMEREMSSRELEAKSARMQLEKVIMIKERIIEERTQLISEFEALKEHVKVLETQNMTVRLSIINILATS